MPSSSSSARRLDEFTTEMVRPLVEKAALVHAINDAWLLIGIVTAVSLAVMPLVRRPSPRSADFRQQGIIAG